jgi:L-asparaginase/Glu-tRNA(Gln) amidotransferase subunit D
VTHVSEESLSIRPAFTQLDGAISTASATEGLVGPMLCFEQDFHAARDVPKIHTSRTDTFVSHGNGKFGEVDGDRVVVHRRPYFGAPPRRSKSQRTLNLSR